MPDCAGDDVGVCGASPSSSVARRRLGVGLGGPASLVPRLPEALMTRLGLAGLWPATGGGGGGGLRGPATTHCR